MSVVGADDAGRALVAGCKEVGVTARAMINVGGKKLIDGGGGDYRTASYVGVLGGNGELVAAVADMRILDTMDSVSSVSRDDVNHALSAQALLLYTPLQWSCCAFEKRELST